MSPSRESIHHTAPGERGYRPPRNEGVESARTGERERLHDGTDAKIHLAKEGLCGLVDSQSPRGGAGVAVAVLAERCGSALDRQVENYQAAKQASGQDARDFVDRQLHAALEEARAQVQAHYVRNGVAGNFQRAFSFGLAKMSTVDGRLCAHVMHTPDMRMFVCRGKRLVELEEGGASWDSRTKEGEEDKVEQLFVEEGDRIILMGQEEVKQLSTQGLARFLLRYPNAKGAERAIQDAAVEALRSSQRRPVDVDVSAVVFEVKRPEVPVSATPKERGAILSLAERRQKQEQVVLLGQEIAGLERRVSEAREIGASALEQAELAQERWRLEQRKAKMEYEIALSEVLRLREKCPPLFSRGDQVRHQTDPHQKTGWMVMGFDDRMVLPPQGTFNDHFGMYEIRAPGSDRTAWVNQFQLEAWQRGTPSQQQERTIGFEAHQKLRASILAFHHAQEQCEIWKTKHQSLVVGQARAVAHREGARQSVAPAARESSDATDEQRRKILELKQALTELRGLEVRGGRHLSSAQEARRKELYLHYITPYGGWTGAESLLKQLDVH